MELLPVIKPLVDFLKPKSILDYGCGKGNLVKALAEIYTDIKVYGYDPSVEEFDKMSTDKVDFVICTDVLEHIPEDELPETISRIASLSQNVFFHLHHAKASAVLPNGENAHCTIWTPQQYANLFKNFFTTLNFLPGISQVHTSCVTFNLPQNIVANWELLLHENVISYVENLNQLIQLINSREEVIIFPIGGEGQALLDLLRYLNLLDRVACIAAIQVEDGYAQRVIHEVPIIPFENLIHFRDTATFILAGMEQHYGDLKLALTRWGCKNLVFLKNSVHAQVKTELQRIANSGQLFMWYFNHLDKRITNLSYQLSDQIPTRDFNTDAFEKYRNAFRGREVVIVGAGPTLNYYKPIPNAIHIGLNYAWKNENISLDYLFTGDNHANTPKQTMDAGFTKIRDRVFIFRQASGSTYEHGEFPEHRKIATDNIAYVYGSTLINGGLGQFIHQDICRYNIAGFYSIVFPALHFALFTYPKKIYLVGCDTTRTGHFFDQEEIKRGLVKPILNTMIVKVGYARMKMFAKHFYPDTEIISINPVGLRGLFSDVYTEEYKASLAKNI